MRTLYTLNLSPLHTNISITTKYKQTQALAQALQYRSNRITDTSLFDAAHSLGRYEITGTNDSSLELANLFDDVVEKSEEADADKSTDATEEDKTEDEDRDGDGDNTKDKEQKQ